MNEPRPANRQRASSARRKVVAIPEPQAALSGAAPAASAIITFKFCPSTDSPPLGVRADRDGAEVECAPEHQSDFFENLGRVEHRLDQ